MKNVVFKAIPFNEKLVILALESGVDAILTSADKVESVYAIGRVNVLTLEDLSMIELRSKSDEEEAVRRVNSGERVILVNGWEVIPVENILAQTLDVGLEVDSLNQARLAAGILEHGANLIVILPKAAQEIRDIVAEFKFSHSIQPLAPAKVTEIIHAGLGHRVCVDTISILKKGQGMLVGNFSTFTFLVHAETEANTYVAARPFRVNAGAVHAYCILPGDKMSYLEELHSGQQILVVDASGTSSLVTVGRIKVEVRPMLLITAQAEGKIGQIFLQHAETVRLTRIGGEPVSVSMLKPGDEVLVRVDDPGRHFGIRIREEIKEC